MPFIRGSGLRGYAFPIDKGKEGYWSRKNAAAIRDTSIKMILGTRRGERVGLPEFGSNLHLLMFEPQDAILEQQVLTETAEAVSRWDPFVSIQGIATDVNDDQITIFIDFIDLADETRITRRTIFSLSRT